MNQPLSAQRGVALVVVLLFTLTLALLALRGIGGAGQAAENVESNPAAQQARAAAQQVIEAAIGTLGTFTDPAAAPLERRIDMDSDGRDDHTVMLQPPLCLASDPAPGYSYASSAIAPQDTVWALVATATDRRSGIAVTVRQGIRVRLPAGTPCPG